jgi:hypothetical protein
MSFKANHCLLGTALIQKMDSHRSVRNHRNSSCCTFHHFNSKILNTKTKDKANN